MSSRSEKTLTIITTTYNRAYCLHQVYESLCRQNSNDFLWMIIDDGSTDNTKELIDTWKKNGKIEIVYYYKQNGGMHTARNMAYEKVQTEINVIIDSDDWMTDDAVEKIISFWNEHKKSSYYGIIAENVDPKGCLIGSPLPANIVAATMTDVFGKYSVKGDKKIILRSDLSRLFPFPEFPGEKFYPASYKYKQLDQEYQLLIMPEPVCVVDYNDDSMTYDKYSQYKTCAKGFAHYRNEMMKIEKGKALFQDGVHYVAESKLAGNKSYIRKSSRPGIVILCWPTGNLLYFYLNKTKRKY